MIRRFLVPGLLICVLPLHVQAGHNKKHSITLSWIAPLTKAGETVVGYNVYRSDKENGQYKLLAKQISSLTYVDTTVRSGHTYYYKVTSVDNQGRESVAVRTRAQAGRKKKHSVTLNWNAPVAKAGETVVGYNVYRSEKENGQYQLLAKQISSLTYVDTAVRSGHTYYYKVTSVDNQGRESVGAITRATVP